jgi:WD40 repeat protein/Tfp pilus assembly protein PilF
LVAVAILLAALSLVGGGSGCARREAAPLGRANAGGTRGLVPLGEPGGETIGTHAAWAVIVGIDRYPGGGSGLEPLRFAVNDARALRDVLRDDFGYAADRITFLTDRQATREGLGRALGAGLGRVGPDDALLVFFAGHGLIAPGTNEGYLALADSRADDLHGSCLAVAAIRDRLAALRCRHKVLILDSCYSGSLFEDRPATAPPPGGAGAGTREREPGRGAAGPGERSAAGAGRATPTVVDNLGYYQRRSAFWGMSAGRFTPVADGAGDAAHSIFTAKMLEVLAEQADSPRADHAFTFRQLASQVESRVAFALRSRQIPDWGRLGPGDGDFVFHPAVLRPTPRELSEQRQATAQQRLVRMYVREGTRQVNGGDLLGALPWFAEALLEDQGNPAHERVHRTRLAAVLRQCPRIARVWEPSGTRSVEFSPDGRQVVTAGWDGAARVWDVATGDLIATLPHEDPVNHATFSPDGRLVATATGHPTGRHGRGEARVWEIATGRPVTPALRHRGPDKDDPQVRRSSDDETQSDYIITGNGVVTRAGFSPDGRRVVTASDDRSARVWDVAAGALAFPPLEHGDEVKFAGFSPDGRWIVTVAAGAAWTWDAATGRPGRKFDGDVAALAPVGERLAFATPDGTVQVCALTTGAPTGPAFGTDRPHRLAFGPDGSLIAVTGSQGVRIWDVETGQPVSPPIAADPWGERPALSRDGRWVATTGQEGVRVWDIATGQPICPSLGDAGLVAFGPTGRMLATSVGLWDLAIDRPRPLAHPRDEVSGVRPSHDFKRLVTWGGGGARLWDPASGDLAAPPLLHGGEPVQVAAFSPDGRIVATAGRDHAARLWAAARGAPLAPPLEHDTEVRHVAFSPDGRLVATACGEVTGESQVRVWDAATGRPVTAPVSHTHTVERMAFSPDGSRLLTVGGTEARLLDPRTGAALVPPLKHPQGVGHAAFSPDGRLVATACGDYIHGRLGEARVWDALTGRPAGPPRKQRACVREVAFTPDGAHLLTLAGGVQVWDVSPADPPREPVAIAWSGSFTFAFSPDGRRVAVAEGNNARVCDVGSGRPITPAIAHLDRVNGLAFSADGLLVLTASEDHTARAWDAATGEPVTPPLRHRGPVRSVRALADHRLVTTTAAPFEACVWDLEDEVRPASELRTVARLLAGRRIDDTGGSIPLENRPAAWNEIRSRDRAPVGSRAPDVDAEGDADAGGDVIWHRREARAAADDGQWRAAVWHLDQAILADPAPWPPYVLRARALRELKRWDLVEADDSRALERGAVDPELFLERGVARSHLGRFEAAEADFSEAITQGLSDWNVRLWHGSARAEQSREVAAAADFDVVLHLVSPQIVMRVLDEFEDDRRWLSTAALLGRIHDSPYRKQYEFHTEHPFANSHRYPSLEARRQHALEQAIADLTSAIGRDPVHDQASTHARRGEAYFALGRYDEASRDYDRAVEQDPGNVRYRTRRGACRVELERWSDAVADFTKALELAPDESEPRSRRAYALGRLGRWDEVVNDYNVVLSDRPNDGWAWNGRGLARAKQGRWSEAVADQTRALKLLPGEARIWAHRGFAHASLREWAEAERDFGRASELDTSYQYPPFAVALVRLARGDVEGYRRACAGLLERLGKDAAPEDGRLLALLCAVGPAPMPEPERILDLAGKAVAAEPGGHDVLTALGLALYRTGRIDEAARRLDDAATRRGRGTEPLDLLALALVRRQQSRPREAVELLDAARAWLDAAGPAGDGDGDGGRASLPWPSRLMVEVLLREAGPTPVKGAEADKVGPGSE